MRPGPTPSDAEQRGFEADPRLPLVPTEAVPRCDACGGEAASPLGTGYDYELRTCRNRWTFVTCARCPHVWLHPRPALEALPVIYPPSYYAYNYEATVPVVARLAKAWLDRRKLAGILRALPGPVRRYADIGCGTGRYLRAMARAGVARADIHGLELDAATVASLRSEGFAAHCARVETCTDIPDGSLDLATMFHVLEHVASPSLVLARLARWLAPGGVLALETPNLDSLDARTFRGRWWGGYHFPRHWHLFTADSLGALLRSHGLTPLAVRYQPGHSFWMYSLHHALRYGRRPWPRLAAHLDPFRHVPPLAAATAFDLVRARCGARTSAMLVLARRDGSAGK